MIETQNNGYVLGVYGLLFGIALPWFVGSWWYGSRRVTKDGALTTTADGYFKELKEDVDFEKAVEILSGSSEFSPANPKGPVIKNLKNEKAFKVLQEEVFAAMRHQNIKTSFIGEALKSPKKEYAGKAALLLYAHMLRVPVKDVSLLRGMSQLHHLVYHMSNADSITFCRSNGRCRKVNRAMRISDAYFTRTQLASSILDRPHASTTPHSRLPPVSVTTFTATLHHSRASRRTS